MVSSAALKAHNGPFFNSLVALPSNLFERHNAYRNFGVALQGLGCYQEAARACVGAVHRNAADPRAMGHLETLAKEHPELEFDLLADLECCRKAMAVALEKVEKVEPKLRLKKGKPHEVVKPYVRRAFDTPRLSCFRINVVRHRFIAITLSKPVELGSKHMAM